MAPKKREIASKRTLKPRKKKDSDRLDDLEKWRAVIGDEIFNLKKELALLVFQTVSIIMSFFAIVLAVLIGFSTNWEQSNYVTGLLVFLAILLSIWAALWFYLNFWKKKK